MEVVLTLASGHLGGPSIGSTASEVVELRGMNWTYVTTLLTLSLPGCVICTHRCWKGSFGDIQLSQGFWTFETGSSLDVFLLTFRFVRMTWN